MGTGTDRYTDKRTHPRVRADFPTRLDYSDGTSQLGRTVNLSLGGAMVAVAPLPDTGAAATISIELSLESLDQSIPGNAVVSFDANVVRINRQPDAVGVRIRNIDRDNLARLKSAVQEIRVRTVVLGRFVPRLTLHADQRRALGAAILRWRSEQSRGTIQHFDTQAAGALASGQSIDPAGIAFAVWESSYDRERLIASLQAAIPEELVQDIMLAGSSWNI